MPSRQSTELSAFEPPRCGLDDRHEGAKRTSTDIVGSIPFNVTKSDAHPNQDRFPDPLSALPLHPRVFTVRLLWSTCAGGSSLENRLSGKPERN